MELVQRKQVRFHETNDVILFEDLSNFIGYNVNMRHPFTGTKMTRICKSGKVSSVFILHNGSLLEIRYGEQYPKQRRQFPSYTEWYRFLEKH